LIWGRERFRRLGELMTVFGKPVFICRACVERALAGLRPS
jgi:hypothetical protein